MAQYTKHNSNYIKTVEHQHLKDGTTIFERDWVTIGSRLNFGPGKRPYYNDGNFIFTTSPTPFYYKRYRNGVTVATWTYDDVKDATGTVNSIQFDEYTEDIRSFAYYGSCVELLRSTVEKIIGEFPGNIKVSDEDLGVYKKIESFPGDESSDEKYVPLCDYGESGDRQTYWVLKNPFGIDLISKDVKIGRYDNPLRYLTQSWDKYRISTNGGETFTDITSYSVDNRKMYEKDAPTCYETVKQSSGSVTLNRGQSKRLSIAKGNYFIDINGVKKNHWSKTYYVSGDRTQFSISAKTKSIEFTEDGNVTVTLSDSAETKHVIDTSGDESVRIKFYREVKIARNYKYYQMLTDDEFNRTYESKGWYMSRCVMDYWLPDTVFLNRCDDFQENIIYSDTDTSHNHNQPVYTVTVNGSIKIEGYIYGGRVIPLVKNKNLVIQPKDDVIEEYFASLRGFEKQILTRKTKPLYTNRFITPLEYDMGYLYYNRTYTWPSDGYCIDILSTAYDDFINRMVAMAEKYDDVWTDNLWRRMTHEAIKNYDWTYTREYNDGDEQDNVDGGERMHKVINVIGRVFDDIKLSIDTIKRLNRITYSGDRNSPNALISDKLEMFGWDVYSTIPSYSDGSGTVSAANDTIGETYPWYPTSDPNEITFADVDVEFMRRLLLSTRRILQTKGTRHSIDMVMALFGYYPSKTRNDTEGDYLVCETYMKVTPRRYDEKMSGSSETFGDRIVRLNTVEKDYLLQYDDDASGIPLGSFIGGYDDNGDPITYIIPYYDMNKTYDGDIYFQSKGGWGYYGEYNGDRYEITDVDPSKWTETLSYLHVVSQVKDLLNVNPFEVKNGDIYYVVNLSDYIEFSESTDISLKSHFFVMKNELMPEELSSWLNIDMEDGSDNAKKAKYLEGIIPYNLGNNPHVGFGEYDMGEEYVEYMRKPFKYAIDRNAFQYGNIDDAETITFKYTNPETGQTLNGIHKEETIDVQDKIITYNDDTREYHLNSKVFYLVNKVEEDGNEYKKYFKDVILKYLMQVIPSTAILVLIGFENK